MILSEWLTLLAIALNLITLGVVISQTRIAKKSYDMSAESFKKDKQIREISLLPKMYFVIHVQIEFDKWIKTLNEIKTELEIVARDGSEQALKQIAEKGPKSCEGLVERFMYEKSPNWLAELYMSGAKHYYNSMTNLKSLWNDKTEKGNLFMINQYDVAESLIDRFKESIYFLEELKRYINDAIPDVILLTPDSISDDRFLSKN